MSLSARRLRRAASPIHPAVWRSPVGEVEAGFSVGVMKSSVHAFRLRRGLSKPMSKASDKNIRPTWMRGQLGKIHIERIDVLCADVTHEDARIIRRLPAPRPPEAKVAAQTA